jgi:hypothetical protein
MTEEVSSCDISNAVVVKDILARLKQCSSAEDFFTELKVKFDPKVLGPACTYSSAWASTSRPRTSRTSPTAS